MTAGPTALGPVAKLPRVLVTGSSGRLGSAMCQRLAQTHGVCGLDRLPGAYTTLLHDLADRHDAPLRAALVGRQAVVHTAALHAPHVGLNPDTAFERINVAATLRLWQLAAEAGVRVFVFTSTTALHGAGLGLGTRASWITEQHPPQPQTIYHRSKLVAEQALTAAALAPGAPLLRILRVGRCFAEPAPLMAVYRLHRGIDARDVAEAHALALDQALASAPCGPQLAPVPRVARWLISGATPFLPGDAAALAHDAAAVLRLRAPALVAAFQQRGWPLPSRIDRVYDPGHAARTLGFVSRQGWQEVLRQCDTGSPEVLPVDAA